MSVSIRYIVIIIIGSLLFVPFLGHVHLFDWDEINFAECAREMIASKDYLRPQVDFMPFWEKPPLFIWMQVFSMKIFGVGDFAARFPNALIGIATLVAIFHIGKRVVNEKMGTWWALLYAATWLPHFYFKSGIIDPTFNFFIFLAFFQVHLLKLTQRKLFHATLAGLFIGLAVLTKGPVAILVSALSLLVYLVINRGLGGLKAKYIILIMVYALIPITIWLIITAVTGYGVSYDSRFVSEFLIYQVRLFRTEDAGHGGPFFYHFVVLLIGCFPASAFLFQYTRKKISDNERLRDFTQWMWILFWVVLILFSIVQSKIVHYSSLCYFPLTYLAALQLYRLNSEHVKPKKWVLIILLSVGSLIAILITALPLVGIYKEKLIPYIQDPFAVGNLQANVSWSIAECGWGLVYLIGIWVAVLLMRSSFRKGMILLCIVQILIIQTTVIHFTPKIEAYSQRAAIEFFESFQGKDVYIRPLDYHSYAHLFYSRKQPSTNPLYYNHGKVNQQWLLTGNVDKPTYFICKIQDAPKYRAMPQLEETGGSNGFVFFKRR